jgi:uncharacterized protein (TIGR00251 family)
LSSILAIRVTPRSARPGIGEWKSDPGGRPFLEIRVAAAPTDGSANAEVIKLIARALGLAKSEVTIVSGETARLKRLKVPLAEHDVQARLLRVQS